MAYIVTRDIPELKLVYGQKLEHEKGKLPDALKFSASWQEPEVEPEQKPKRAKAE